MALAIKSVKDSKMGYLNWQSKQDLFNVPKTTLIRRVQGKNKIAKGVNKFLGNKESILPKNIEDELYSYIISMEDRLFGLTKDDLRSMVFQLAERNNVPHNFNRDTK